MCTVTLIAVGPSLRMACNRDELRTRPAALPAQARRFGRRAAILPIDPVSDGTWVAVNDAGVAMTLLNTYAGPAVERRGPDAAEPGEPSTRRALSSRGRIIPSLLHCDAAARAAALVDELRAADYPPFRLVLVDGHDVIAIDSDGAALSRRDESTRNLPLLFTSSGLGDALVEPPRRALFAEMFSAARQAPAVQDAFHRHSWPDRSYLSVCMRRDAARTVSHTVIEIGPEHVSLTYCPRAPDEPGPAPQRLELERRPAVSCR
jgi:hypothetical protein